MRQTTCPFCLNGCTSGVTFDGYQYRMHYVTGAEVNKGRLCPRGNAASIVLDHPERACRPLHDGRETTWAEAERTVRGWLADVRPEEVAIVYSRGRSTAEVRRLHGLARELGTPNLVCGHIEPENAFNVRMDGVASATLEQVRQALATLLVGDVFSTSPVASWRMLEARYADRRSRLVVIDSIRTRQAGFAHEFIQVLPGTESLALVALAALIDPSMGKGLDIDGLAAAAGVDRALLAAAAKMLGPKVPGFVGCAAHTGRVAFPVLHSLAAQLVARASQKPFVGFRETGLPAGSLGFAEFRQKVADGRIRMVFWTGGLYPYSYAELLPELAKVPYRVATAIFNPDPAVPGLMLPLAAELERSSAGNSYWGAVERSALATPYSGTRRFEDVISWFGRADEFDPEPVRVSKVDDVFALLSKVPTRNPVADGFLLLGEKKAIGLRGFYDREEAVCLHPADAASLGVDWSGYVRVTTATGSREFRVHPTDAVSPGTAAVGANVHANRGLFPIGLDETTSDVAVPPSPAKIEKIGRVVQQGGENPSVWT